MSDEQATFNPLNEVHELSRFLGRLVRHDPQSRDYPAQTVALKSVLWPVGPILDQSQFKPLGGCTGNAGCGVVNSLKIRAKSSDPLLDELDATAVYSLATVDDAFSGTWPPTDAGSSGLGAVKALKRFGLIRSYTHAFGLDHALGALANGPVMFGIPWLENMFNPDVNGLLNVSGAVAGGHEIAGVGLDVERKLVILQNSWGRNWGRNGLATIKWDDLGSLLDQQGDVTVPVI